ncbi:hypothetical protein V8F33_008254 [Rhypophila sp. PSN 637]
MSSHKVWKPRAEIDLQGGVAAQALAVRLAPIAPPPNDPETIKSSSDRITLNSFTPTGAYTLGHLIWARLTPLSKTQPCVISISTSTGVVLFQIVTGPGTKPDHQTWVDRKRRAVLRWGCSTWLMSRQFDGDEERFRKTFAMSESAAGQYCIHGGGVPIFVDGVEGVVGVVVVSGLRQQEDHGVVFEALEAGWE